MFEDKAGACPSGFPYRITLQGYVSSYAVNIRLGLKLLIVTNTLAYDASELITTVKSLEALNSGKQETV
jgi:hypothetical protein